jgi:transcriptional regulator GlxA family with amidase domain
MASGTRAKPTFRVAVLLFPDADILDFAGPIEVLSHASHNTNRDAPEPVFSIETISRTKDAPISTGHGTMFVQPSMSLSQSLEALNEFDVLIVPGGPRKVVQGVIAIEDGLELQLIKSFAKLPPTAKHRQERIILSVCTGALLLGAAGVLGGLKVTTHHQALDVLQTICDRCSDCGTAEGRTEVVGGQRFVDAGLVKDSLRVVTAGGISSGLDAALHLVELVKDRETAEVIARAMEYQRRQI